jgi:hypothetical protein
MMDKAKKFLKKIQLKNQQRSIDKQYAQEGLTDEVLEKQIELNTLRHDLDIPDSNNFVYEKYVQ